MQHNVTQPHIRLSDTQDNDACRLLSWILGAKMETVVTHDYDTAKRLSANHSVSV